LGLEREASGDGGGRVIEILKTEDFEDDGRR
jgi:hypothetical protein